MNINQLTHPQRVWINSPSSLQPYHEYHGKIGIAVKEGNNVRIYFTEGSLISMLIDPMYLSIKH